MVEYADSSLFPFPRPRVWELLDAHMDPALAPQIHAGIKSQTLVSRDGYESVVRRTIDARGKMVVSDWKVSSRPPDMNRWEIVNTQGGPWTVGSWLESRYTEVPGGTRIDTKGDVKIQVLPFFLPQRRFIRQVFDEIDQEDQAYLRR